VLVIIMYDCLTVVDSRNVAGRMSFAANLDAVPLLAPACRNVAGKNVTCNIPTRGTTVGTSV
jgi:hypothetical protein